MRREYNECSVCLRARVRVCARNFISCLSSSSFFRCSAFVCCQFGSATLCPCWMHESKLTNYLQSDGSVCARKSNRSKSHWRPLSVSLHPAGRGARALNTREMLCCHRECCRRCCYVCLSPFVPRTARARRWAGVGAPPCTCTSASACGRRSARTQPPVRRGERADRRTRPRRWWCRAEKQTEREEKIKRSRDG